MESKWLADFLSIAETQSFSRSASVRHITQSALSRRIQQLEQWLNVSLFDRTVSPVRLSPSGEDFLPRARELLSLLQTTRDEVGRGGDAEDTCLSFAMLSSLSLTFFPTWVQAVGEACGPFNSRLSHHRPSFSENVASLTSGESDILLTYALASVPLGIDSELYCSHGLGYEKVLPVSAPDREGRPRHSLHGDGSPIQFLSYGNATFFALALRSLLVRRPLPLKPVYENAMSAGLKAMALTGMGVAWLPYNLIADELRAGTLVPAGDASWVLEPEIRMYRCMANKRSIVDRFWAAGVAGETALVQAA